MADGIYWADTSQSPEGNALKRPVRRLDGETIFIRGLATGGFGKASLTSTANDNSRYRLDLTDAGPFPDGRGPRRLAFYIDGVCGSFVSQTDRRADGSMDLVAYVPGEAAAKIAAQLGIEARARKHPGHLLAVRWHPKEPSYRLGEPVVLRLEIRNVGQRTIHFCEGGRQRGARDNQFAFIAHRNGGWGKAVPDTGDPDNKGGPGFSRTLDPDGVFTKEVEVTKWFSFQEPGTYQLTCMYEIELSEHNVQFPIWDEYVVGKCLIRVEAPAVDDKNSVRR